VAQVAPIGSIGLKTTDKMEIGLLSNQKTTTSLVKMCMWYYSCLFYPFFKSTIKTLNHPLQSILQVHVACTLTIKRSPKLCRVKKRMIICDNVILVLVLVHELIHNLVFSCVFDIFMTYTTIHFHFFHKNVLGISQTPNLHFILTRFSFHI
jgi:hypothetical protein